MVLERFSIGFGGLLGVEMGGGRRDGPGPALEPPWHETNEKLPVQEEVLQGDISGLIRAPRGLMLPMVPIGFTGFPISLRSL